MNKKIIFCGWLLLSCMMQGPALSGEMRMIKVDLGYSDSAVSYKLYKNGVQVCTSNIPNSTQMDCEVEIDATPMTFALTTVDATGVETPQSEPYILAPSPLYRLSGNYIPNANFTVKATSTIAPWSVNLDASCSSDPDGMIINYAWRFGDGGTASGNLIDYNFAAPGTYSVTLRVIDNRGSIAEKTSTIIIGDQTQVTGSTPMSVITSSPLRECQDQITMKLVDSPKLAKASPVPFITGINRK